MYGCLVTWRFAIPEGKKLRGEVERPLWSFADPQCGVFRLQKLSVIPRFPELLDVQYLRQQHQTLLENQARAWTTALKHFFFLHINLLPKNQAREVCFFFFFFLLEASLMLFLGLVLTLSPSSYSSQTVRAGRYRGNRTLVCDQSKSHSSVACVYSVPTKWEMCCRNDVLFIHSGPRRRALNSLEVHSACWADFPPVVLNMNVHVENTDICMQQHQDGSGGQHEICWRKEILMKGNKVRVELLMEPSVPSWWSCTQRTRCANWDSCLTQQGCLLEFNCPCFRQRSALDPRKLEV